MLKLNTKVTDTATGLKGTLTHLHIEMGGNQSYCFQPVGLNPETRQPHVGLWLVAARIKGGVEIPTPSYLPMVILGTEVCDKHSGLKGMAIALQLHLNGCVHVMVQPEGTLSNSKAPIEVANLDVRRLTGKHVPKQTEEQIEESQQKRPSPAYAPPRPR